MSPMVWLVLALAVLGFAIAWPVTWILVVVGGRGLGLDSSGAPGHSKKLREIPNTGGLAIFLAVAGPVAATLVAVWTFQPQTWTQMGLGVVVQHLSQIKGTTPTALAMLAGMAFLHMLGLIDDRRSLNPWLKLAVQLAVAFVIVWRFDVRLLTMLGPVPSIVRRRTSNNQTISKAMASWTASFSQGLRLRRSSIRPSMCRKAIPASMASAVGVVPLIWFRCCTTAPSPI